MAILCQPAAWPGDLTTSIGGDVTVVDSIEDVERKLAADPGENLIVIGPAIEGGQALAFVATLRTRRAATGVVLIRDHVDVTVLTEALRAGVREVVPTGALAELAEACERSRELSRSVTGGGDDAGPTGEIITVFSAKGGTGKTTIAVNLACALAQDGAKSVCLVDLDLAFGDVAISLQLDPARTIIDGLAMAGRLDATGVKSLLTPHSPGLSVLVAPVSPGDAERVPPALVSELLTVLRTMVDYVVVDTPSQFSEHVLNAMDASQHHVLLTTPEVPALKNLRLTLDMLDLLSYPREIRSVVFNRSDTKVGLTAEDVERVVRAPIAAHVPSSRAVPVSINKGTPLVIANPGHSVGQAIVRFARATVLAKSGAKRLATPKSKAAETSAPKPGAFARLRKGRG